jgi:uncharacterized membrane protein YkvA (DUF1232 family)
MTNNTRQEKALKIFEKLKKSAEALLKDPAAAMKVVDEAAEKAKKESKRIDAIKSDFANLILMLKAYFGGSYKKLPWTTIISGVAALLYFINPFDAIPDFILGFGMIDDATVIAFCLRSIKQDLDQFVAFRGTNIEPLKESLGDTE